MPPSITDWITAIVSIITGLVSIIGIFIALYQITQIKNELKNTTLTNVLSLESEMNDRKEKVDSINNEIEEKHLAGKLTQGAKEVYSKFHAAAIENWLNSVDRLCYCIKHNYLSEKDWKAEYRDYIINVVKAHEDKFGAASRYNNIKDINEKWLRE